MSKVLRIVAIAIIAALCLQVPCYASVATSTENDITRNEVINVETFEEAQKITIIKGNSYVISFPISDGEWSVSQIMVKVQNIDWLVIKEGDENLYLEVEECKIEYGRVWIRFTCKMDTVEGLKIIILNEETKETKEHTLQISVKTSSEELDSSDVWDIIIPVIPDNPDDKEDLIIIDTSGWVFEGIKTVYDGKEYVAVVKGLPDYVKAIYHDNKRTNAGSNKAYVTFEVPEGYAVPEGMETDIIIDKATIEAFELDRNWMATDLINGTLQLKMPSWVAPAGVVNCTYKVNGTNVGNNFILKHSDGDAGMYSVEANFSLAEGMEQNYNLLTETSNIIYDVQADNMGGEKPKFEILLSEGIPDSEGEKKVSVWIKYLDETFKANNAQWHIRYDTNVLELNTDKTVKGPTSGSASQKEYDGTDSSGYGNSMIFTGGYYADGVALETIVFDVTDSEAENIVVNLTKVQASDMWELDSTEYSQNYGIVLNQTANIVEVTLPAGQKNKASSISEEENSDEQTTLHDEIDIQPPTTDEEPSEEVKMEE